MIGIAKCASKQLVLLLYLLLSHIVGCSKLLKHLKNHHLSARPPTAAPSLVKRDWLTDREVLSFFKDGHLRLDGLFDKRFLEKDFFPEARRALAKGELSALRHQIGVVLGDPNADRYSLEDCITILDSSTIPKSQMPFLQVFHLWKSSEMVRKLAFSPVLGRLACQLLDVPAVRLYQDSLFVKRPGDGPTMWHSDLNMAPFDSNSFLTFWVPLTPVPAAEEGGTGLVYASTSHRTDPATVDLEGRYPLAEYGRFQVGDCAVHHGWCLHCTQGNVLDQSRYAYVACFVADRAPLLMADGHLRRPDNEDAQSYAGWIKEVGWGGEAAHPLLPVVYDEDLELADLQILQQETLHYLSRKQ
eukprot:scaffold2582_cov162-Ochromonas_danica.AAC.35